MHISESKKLYFFLKLITNSYTDAKSSKSNLIYSILQFLVRFFIFSIIFNVFSLFRQAKIKVELSFASSMAVSSPIPDVAPVKIIIFPLNVILIKHLGPLKYYLKRKIIYAITTPNKI